MDDCEISASLRRRDRHPIYWPIKNLPPTATVKVELEASGVWHALQVEGETAAGLFAGPDFPTPGAAIVVPSTSHCLLEITTTDGSRRTRDGGIISVLP